MKFSITLAYLCALACGARIANAQVTHQDLGGAWSLRQADKTDEIPAQVPGSVFLDLMRAQKILDPFFGNNEKEVQWVGEKSWVYRRQFTATPALLRHQFVILNCQGLDTLATIRLNGKELGQTDNMFRRWQFDVKPLLKSGANDLEISFASTFPYLAEKRKLANSNGSFVRKAPYHYGWDWGPILVDSGIWKPIELLAYDNARIGEIGVRQDHSQENSVGLTVETALANAQNSANLRAQISVSLNGKSVGNDVQTLRNGRATSVIVVDNPQLWWPNEMGAHPLYVVKIRLLDNEKTLDETSRRIGLRTIKLRPKTEQSAIQLEINGVPFFAKGSNWIPSDSFAPRVTRQKLRDTVAVAVSSHMNMLRFWGGGYYEEDALFDACDESGILVWQDFKFANSFYPTSDAQWMENVRAEVSEQIERLHTHPSIAVWCGNNEMETLANGDWRDGYNRLFNDLIGGAVRQKLPDAVYTPSSPGLGDEHYWGVYHVGQSFESFRGVHGFISEFGMQSFLEPRSTEAFTLPADRVSTGTPVMNNHQKGKGNATILEYINRYFRAPITFDDTLWLSQIMQGYGIQIGVESWRREMPRSSGALIWQLNDCWPVASWSAIDYYGRPKALQYLTRRFYNPLLLSGLANAQTGRASIWLTSDLMRRTNGNLHWRATDCAGKWLREGEIKAELAEQSSREIVNLDLSDLLEKQGAGNLLVWLDFANSDAKGESSENLLMFGKPKILQLQNPQVEAQIVGAGKNYAVTLRAAHPALWGWIDVGADAKLSDNFINLRAGAPKTIQITLDAPMTLAQFKTQLKVRSLFDTYDANAMLGDPLDLARNRPLRASSTEGNNGNIPANAVDGDDLSRWSSEYGDPQWIAVDLGADKMIGRVKLKWESAFAVAYQIQLSDDGDSWRTVYETEKGQGGTENIALPADSHGRWVRMLGTRRATNFGYSLWSFGVY